jgi:hypothetical protein
LAKSVVLQSARSWTLIACIAGVSRFPLIAQDFKKQVIYQIITGRFYDGDPTNNDPPQSPACTTAPRQIGRLIGAAILPASRRRYPI